MNEAQSFLFQNINTCTKIKYFKTCWLWRLHQCTFYSIRTSQEPTAVSSEFLVCLERGKGARGSSWSCGAAQRAARGRSPRPLSGMRGGRPPPPVLSSQGGKATVWSAEWKEAARRVWGGNLRVTSRRNPPHRRNMVKLAGYWYPLAAFVVAHSGGVHQFDLSANISVHLSATRKIYLF
jgi:hypothetical protein